VPSYDPADHGYDRRRYWRGAVWVNTNWLIWHGLRQHNLYTSAIAVAGSTMALVQRSGFREYFDPTTGEGYGSHDFSWTAALLLDLLAH
jgi:glycogen debranching enzyme